MYYFTAFIGQATGHSKGGQDIHLMADSPHRICHYFFTEECPYQLAITKAILIPQLLDQRELERTAKLCETCEKCRGERRTSLRTKRALKVTLNNGDIGGIEGTIVDISSTGALIGLEDPFDLRVGEKVKVNIYSESSGKKTKQALINQRCVIRRIQEQDQQVAVMFLSERK